MARPRLIAVGAILASLAVALYLATPPALVNAASTPQLPDDIDSYLAASERRVAEQFRLIPDTQKRVVWREPGARTDFAVVHLHGFSATRQETAPLAERVAAALDANLFETRLAGHGHEELPMHAVSAEDWLDDAAEALAIGARLGDKVVVIGTSTGGTLALAMSDHESARAVTDIVLISPNVAPDDGNAKWLTCPAGPIIARLIAGDTQTWQAHNEKQERYWSTSYPIEAAVEVMRLVDLLHTRLPLQLEQNLLVLLSPDDKVVSAKAMRDAYVRIDSPRKRLVEVEDVQDPSNHVLAGDILAPDTTDEIAASVVRFLLADRSIR